MDGVYGWKMLFINDGLLISPSYETVWPTNNRYLVADDFPEEYRPGDRLRGEGGIHAVSADNLEVVSPKDPTHHSASVTFTAMKAIFSLESTEPKLLRVIAEALIRCGTEYRQYDLCDIFYIPPHYEEAEFVGSMEEFESYRGEGPFAVVFDEWGTWDYALIDSNIELTMSIDKDQYELVDYYQYKKPSPEDQDKMDSYLINTAGISSEIAGAYIEWQ